MTNEPTDGVYPLGLGEEINVAPRTPQGRGEITVNAILADWEDYPGLEPAFVTNLRASQPSRATSREDVEELLPPGVE